MIPFLIIISFISFLVGLIYRFLIRKADNEPLFKRKKKYKPRVYPDEELAYDTVIALFDYVESNRIHLFAKLIAYYGYDTTRHLRTHLNHKDAEEIKKVNLYLNVFREVLEVYRKIDPETDFYGHLTPQFLVFNKTHKITIDSKDMFRVYMKLCAGDDEEGCTETYIFDVVKGDNDFFLVDVQEQQLYKKFTSYQGTYRF